MSVTTVFFIVTVVRYILVGVLFYIAYIMGKNHVDYAGWVIFTGIMIGLFGGYSLSSKDDVVTCPECKYTFKVESNKADNNSQTDNFNLKQN